MVAMTKPAVIAGTYQNLRPVMSRRVVQVIIELKVEQLTEFVNAFGEPNPDKWIALARMDFNGDVKASSGETDGALGIAASVSHPHKKVAPDRRLAQQAGIYCSDQLFQRFLRLQWPVYHSQQEDDPSGWAARIVREYCGVKSRSDIIPGTPAGGSWDELMGRFENWKVA